MKETAAFYARKGDLQKAVEMVAAAQKIGAGRRLHAAEETPSLDGHAESSGRFMPDVEESDMVMKDILATAKWQSEGPDAAAKMLEIPITFDSVLARGTDTERARLMAWLQRRVYLHLSILLDGNPPPERIAEAFRTLGRVQGRYLFEDAGTQRRIEGMRGTRNDIDNRLSPQNEVTILDERSAARQRRARLFIAAALDGKPFHSLQFAASEAAEAAATAALAEHEKYSRQRMDDGVDGAMPADAALLNFVWWERSNRTNSGRAQGEYGAFVVRKGQPIQYVRLGSTGEVDTEIAAVERWAVEGHARGALVLAGSQTRGPEAARQTLRALYGKIIAPLEASIAGAKKLFIVPDGKLTLTPIGALTDPQGHPLLERYPIAYLNSWRDLAVWDANPAKLSPPVIVANPDFEMTLGNGPGKMPAGRVQFASLPGAEGEAADVAQALGLKEDRVLVGKGAREDLVESILSPEILHLATHSVPFLEWQIPVAPYELPEFPRPLAVDSPLLQSVVALAGANRVQDSPEDGLLTGLEASALHLYGTKLVVLSSCESGQGIPVSGQGVLGLRAAFTMAGADGLVMSLWPIDDKAGRQFMKLFYAHLKAGPAEALRLAQIDMRKQPEYAAPGFWAGYAYSGVSRDNRLRPPEPAEQITDQSLAAPNCLAISAHEEQASTWQPAVEIQLRIGGLVHQTEGTANRAVYELIAPGSDLAKKHGYVGKTIVNAPTETAHLLRRPLFLTVERSAKESGVTIQMGSPAMLTISLKGGPSLFPSLKVPERFPPLSSYTEATVTQGRPERIDRLNYCTVEGRL